MDSERPYLGEGRLQVWLELAVGAGVELPDRLEDRRRRWRALTEAAAGDGEGADGS